MSKRTPGEIWQQLVDEAGEAEIERAASVSVEQAEAELRAAGFDVEAERARADAFLDELARPDPANRARELESQARVRALRPSRRPSRAVLLVAAAATVAVGGGALYATLHWAPEPAPSPPAPSPLPTPSTPVAPPSPDLVAAADMRRRAAVDCNAGRASDCLALLDEAKKRDPAGDAAPEIVRLREQAEREMQAKPKPTLK